MCGTHLCNLLPLSNFQSALDKCTMLRFLKVFSSIETLHKNQRGSEVGTRTRPGKLGQSSISTVYDWSFCTHPFFCFPQVSFLASVLILISPVSMLILFFSFWKTETNWPRLVSRDILLVRCSLPAQ